MKHYFLSIKNFFQDFKSAKAKGPKLLVLVAVVLALLASSYILLHVLTKTERGSVISYDYQNRTVSGKVYALPGESFRIHLDNKALYIKRNGKAYRLIETKNQKVLANYYENTLANEWHFLGENQYLVKRDPATTPLGNFMFEYEVVSKKNIQKKLSGGYVFNLILKPIKENKEFALDIDKSSLVWKKQVEGHIGIKENVDPIIYDNTLYFTAFDNASAPIYSNGWDKKWSKNNILVALNIENGSQKWTVKLNDFIQRIYPDLDSAIVYVSTRDDVIYAFDKQTGVKLWEVSSFPYLKLLDTQNTDIFITASREEILGLDKKTGEKKWSVDISLPEYGKIAFIRSGDKFFATAENNIYFVDLQNGKVIWQYKSDASFVVYEHKDYLFVHSEFRPSVTHPDKLRVINKVTGETVWSHNLTTVGDIRGITVDGDFLYGIDSGKGQSVLWKRDLKSGNLLWNRSLITDAVLSPEQIEFSELYVLVHGAYGGNSYEDTTQRRKFWVMDKDNGAITFAKEIIGYDPQDFSKDSLITFGQIVQSYPFNSGHLNWSYPMKVQDHGSWLLNETKSVLYLADDTKVVALDTENGKELWFASVSTKLQDMSINNNSLYLQDAASGYLWVLDPQNGNIVMKSTSTHVEDSHTIENGDIYIFTSFESEQNQRERILHLAKLSKESKEEKRIFSKHTIYGNDVHFLYKDSNIYVFSDDFVYALKK